MHDVEEIFREDVTLFVAERCCFTFMEIQCYYYFFLIWKCVCECRRACLGWWWEIYVREQSTQATWSTVKKESVVNYNVFDLGEFLTSVIRIIVIIIMIKVIIIKAVAFKFQAYAADHS